tara:strand:+ start:592 stop:1035 length:444 start_codon:yes stop_codon:yes gene_type:complete
MNRQIMKKPHLIFWISIPVLVLIGFLNRKEMLDINIYDTYYVFSKTALIIMISALFGFMGLGYYLMLKAKRKLSRWLNLIHVALTVGGILTVWILTQLFRESIMEYQFNNNLTMAIYVLVIITIFAQILYPINLIGAILKPRNKTTR